MIFNPNSTPPGVRYAISKSNGTFKKLGYPLRAATERLIRGAAMKNEHFFEEICRMLEVSVSGCCDWVKRQDHVQARELVYRRDFATHDQARRLIHPSNLTRNQLKNNL
jgi:hypothetical protein